MLSMEYNSNMRDVDVVALPEDRGRDATSGRPLSNDMALSDNLFPIYLLLYDRKLR
jgi:hypothetical protein